MPDLKTNEEERIKRSIRARKEQERIRKRKRNLRLAISCTIFSVIVIIGAMFIILNSMSDKKSLREEGIELFESGKYSQSIDKFKESIETGQLFGDKLDYDSNMYMAAAYLRINDYKSAYDIYNELDSYKYAKEDKAYITTQRDISNALYQIAEGSTSDENIASLESEFNNGNKSLALYLGTCYQKNGDYDKMLDYYNAYTESFGLNTFIAYQISAYYLDNDNLEAASTMITSGLNCSDDLYKDLLMYNDVVLSEKNHDLEGALSKATTLTQVYPDNEKFKKEYDFLYSRINVDTEPVHEKEED